MNTLEWVPILADGAARRITTVQIRRIEEGSMAKIATLLDYLADNRSLTLLHSCQNEPMGMLTAYLSGDSASVELLKSRLESVFPEFEVLLAPCLGPALRKAA